MTSFYLYLFNEINCKTNCFDYGVKHPSHNE